MTQPSKNLSPRQIALEMQARRTKRMVIGNLCLMAALCVLAVGMWGYRSGWFSSGAASATPVSETSSVNDSVAQPAPVGNVDDSTREPSKYPARKFVVICDVSGKAQPRLSNYLPIALSQFNEKQMVDVIVLGAHGSVTTATHGLTPMSRAMQATVCDFVKSATPALDTSPMGAIKQAMDEQAEAIFLLTTAPHAKDFGPDPVEALKKLTNGQKLSINCIVFVNENDESSDLAIFKSVANSTHGSFNAMTH